MSWEKLDETLGTKQVSLELTFESREGGSIANTV